MTCGLSGTMASAQEDELPFYFKLSVDSTADKSIKDQTSSSFIIFKMWLLFFMML